MDLLRIFTVFLMQLQVSTLRYIQMRGICVKIFIKGI